jgi:hypothetical protein
LKESGISGKFRSFFFQRDFTGNAKDKEDFATGGILRFVTGSFDGISGGCSMYTSQGLGLNNENKGVYNLLAEDNNGHHKSYSALGEAYLQCVFDKTALKAGRQEMQTPWVNGYDIRMTPQSYQAAALSNKNIPDLELYAAYVTKIKPRTATSFIAMSNALGIAQDEPVALYGLIFTGIKGIKVQLWDNHAYEMWNDIYIRADYTGELTDAFSVFGDMRYLNRKGIGGHIAGQLDTWHFGITGGIDAYGARLTLAYAINGNQKILRPWGHDLTIAPQINPVDRADEKALEADIAYDLGRIGIIGLTGEVIYAHFDTPESGVTASPDRDEINFDLRYKFRDALEGLGLRARYAIVNEDEKLGGADFNDIRVYLQYEFQFYPGKKP